ncbi:unnamed protein product [Cuscuta epithymum]|uniref:Uncharacterized protein n=1 Tax=Cuscuta epithymum TaxID=186058 RepID=A0AAV0EY47_9ASTE|nr:unnamed protein product [Cuscuta epithymum]
MMMRCTRHVGDMSSAIGVCASCLREELLAINDAQARTATLHRHDDDPSPPHIAFPRSVSPYTHAGRQPVFYATPQVGPGGQLISWEHHYEAAHRKKKHNGRRRRSLFSHLFNKSSDPPEDDSDDPLSAAAAASNKTSSSSSTTSWFSKVLRRNRDKNNNNNNKFHTISFRDRDNDDDDDRSTSTPTLAAAARHTGAGTRNCGSHAAEDEDEDHCGSSGCSSRSAASPIRKQTTPASSLAQHRGGRKSGGSSRGMTTTFCLSPLVWASPNNRRHKAGMSPEVVYSGQNTVPTTPLDKTRSRKFADFGRFHHNH